MKNKIAKSPDFKHKYVDNVEVVSINERYLVDDDKKRLQRVCGEIKADGRRCLAKAGFGTAHAGVGLCKFHEKGLRGSQGWSSLCMEMTKGTSLGKMLERNAGGDVMISDITEELSFQQTLLLWHVNHVMERKLEDDEGNILPPDFTPADIRILRQLNTDMIKSKESASRIKGSLKIDALTVKKFVDQILSFLAKELEDLLPAEVSIGIVERMLEEVFYPLASQGTISGDLTPLAEIPKNLKDMDAFQKSDVKDVSDYIDNEMDK